MALAKHWYKLLKGGERVVDNKIIKTHGFLDDFPLNTLDGKLIVCATPNIDEHLFNGYQSYLDFIMVNRSMESYNRHFYEIIFGEWFQKPHFDLDFKLDAGYLRVETPLGVSSYTPNQILQHLIRAIIDILQEVGVTIIIDRDILIYSSHSVEKQSYHLIINNWYHRSNLEARGFYDAVVKKIPQELNNGKIIDASVYSKTQQFRIIESTKVGVYRPKTLMESFEFEGQVIVHKYPIDLDTLTSEEREKQLYVLKMEESLVTNIWSCKCLPEFVKEEKTIKTNTTTPLHFEITPAIATYALSKLPSRGAYKITKINDGLIILQRHRPSMCELCKRIHESENPYLRISNTGWISYYCRRNGGNICIGALPPEILHNLKAIENQTILENTINTGLGEFKTDNNPPEQKFIWDESVSVQDLLALKIDVFDITTDTKSINKAAKNGQLDVVKSLYAKGAVPTSSGADLACKNGHLAVVMFLLEKNISPTDEAVDYACTYGHLNIVEFLISKRFKVNKSHLDLATKNGHLDIVKYLVERKLEPTIWTLNRASENGYLEIMKYLLHFGIKPTLNTLELAIPGGYLEIIVELVGVGLKPNKSSIEKAKTLQRNEIVSYLESLN